MILLKTAMAASATACAIMLLTGSIAKLNRRRPEARWPVLTPPWTAPSAVSPLEWLELRAAMILSLPTRPDTR